MYGDFLNEKDTTLLAIKRQLRKLCHKGKNGELCGALGKERREKKKLQQND